MFANVFPTYLNKVQINKSLAITEVVSFADEAVNKKQPAVFSHQLFVVSKVSRFSMLRFPLSN